MKFLIMQIVFLIGCGSVDDGQREEKEVEKEVKKIEDQENAGVIPEIGPQGQHFVIKDDKGDFIGNYAGIANEEILVEIDNHLLILREERKLGNDPKIIVSSGTECNYESDDCSGECLISWLKPSHYYAVGKNGAYERPEDEPVLISVKTYWTFGECKSRQLELQAVIGVEKDLPSIESIRYPLKIVLD